MFVVTLIRLRVPDEWVLSFGILADGILVNYRPYTFRFNTFTKHKEVKQRKPHNFFFTFWEL